jgi:hypothetical protein
MAPRPVALALSLALAAAVGCQSPGGRCDTAADCSTTERCQEGVCVPAAALGGNGSGGGTDPTTYTPVLWSTVQTSPSATFSVDAIGAVDSAVTTDLYVAGAVEGAYDPWGLVTGAFAARLATGGAPVWAVALPSLSPGTLRTAAAQDGGLLYAGVSASALVVGRLRPGDGVVDWERTIPGTHASVKIAPASLAARGNDLLVSGVGAADFGTPCGDTAAAGGNATFVARLDGTTGACVWSRGLGTRAVTDLEPRDQGDVALAGPCTPVGASFDPGSGTTCTKGLFVAALDGASGATGWARFSAGAGTVTAVRDLAVAPDGTLALLGDALGAVSFGGAAVDFGTTEGSFAATFSPAGAAGIVVRPIEAPYAPVPDAASFARAAYDRNGKLWIAGRYYGQPTVGGVRFTACREPGCLAASFLARLEPDGRVGSFLPIRIAPAGGLAFADDLVLFATTGTVAHAQRFTGAATVGTTPWQATAGLGVLRILP